MKIGSHNEKAISRWPLLHPGETAILPDGTAVLIQNIVIGHCTLDAPIPERVAVSVLSNWFQETVRTWETDQDDLALTHPVLVMIANSGGYVGLDGRTRVDFARKKGMPALPVIFVQEDDVRRLGQIDLEFLFEDGKISKEDMATYRTTKLISSVYANHVTSRPWKLKEKARKERAFAAGSEDGRRLGRPYLQVRPEPRIQNEDATSGRKKIPDVVKLDIGIGRTLAAVRDRLHEMGTPRALGQIVDDLKTAKIKRSAKATAVDQLIVSLPTIRQIEKLVMHRSDHRVVGAWNAIDLCFEGLDPGYKDPQIRNLLFHLRDLGTLRLRVKDFDIARNALMDEAKVNKAIDPTHYDRMLFDRSRRPNFHPLPDYLSIPGLIDPMAVAFETGVMACQYHANYLFALPMFRAAAIRGEIDRGINPVVDLPTAIAWLQQRVHLAEGKQGRLTHWWYLAIQNDNYFPGFFDFASLAAVRKREPVLFSEGKAEIRRAMAA
jgi:hypothetical protein